MADPIVLDNGARIQFFASAGQTVFAYPFLIISDQDLCVFLTPAGKTPDPIVDKILLNLGYVVSGVGEPNGGEITLITPALEGDVITITRDIPAEQTVIFDNNDEFRAEDVDAVHSKNTLLIQQNESNLKTRGLLYEPTEILGPGQTTLPKLPPNSGDGIPVWAANTEGNVTAVKLLENQGDSTLRSELSSQIISAPGSDLIGTNSVPAGAQTLTVLLNNLVQKAVLASQNVSTPGSDIVGTNIVGHGPLTLSALLLQLSQGEDSRSENLLLNGNFEFLQRGLPAPVVGSQSLYVMDKWALAQNAGTTEISNPRFENQGVRGIKYNRTVAGAPGEFVTLQQPIEDVNVANGRTISVSFEVQNLSGFTKDVDISWAYVFDGSSPETFLIDTITLPVGVSLQQRTFSLPPFDPASKVIGVNNHSTFKFAFVDQGLFEIFIFNVSVMISGSFHRFIPRARGIELSALQRFYNKSYSIDIAPGTVTLARQSVFLHVTQDSSADMGHDRVFQSEMRTVPTLQIFTPDGSPNLVNFTGESPLFSTNTANFSTVESETSFSLQAQIFIFGLNAISLVYHYTADAEYPIV